MLINFTNHPSVQWSEGQKKAAEMYGEIVDLPFPDVDPMWDSEKIKEIAAIFEKKVCHLLIQDKNGRNAVHLMGELTLCYELIKRLQKMGIQCIASTSRRNTITNRNSKITEFNFCRFREYNM